MRADLAISVFTDFTEEERVVTKPAKKRKREEEDTEKEEVQKLKAKKKKEGKLVTKKKEERVNNVTAEKKEGKLVTKKKKETVINVTAEKKEGKLVTKKKEETINNMTAEKKERKLVTKKKEETVNNVTAEKRREWKEEEKEEISTTKDKHIKLVNKEGNIKLQGMALSQSQMLILNVGGRRYETSASTLKSDPSSILAKIVSPTSCMKPYKVDNIYTYFIDRNGKMFEHVLEFFWNGADITLRNLPNNLWVLRELIIEAELFELDELKCILEQKAAQQIMIAYPEL